MQCVYLFCVLLCKIVHANEALCFTSYIGNRLPNFYFCSKLIFATGRGRDKRCAQQVVAFLYPLTTLSLQSTLNISTPKQLRMQPLLLVGVRVWKGTRFSRRWRKVNREIDENNNYLFC